MKHTRTLLTALLLAPLAMLNAEPLPSSFGVWDRGETKEIYHDTKESAG